MTALLGEEVEYAGERNLTVLQVRPSFGLTWDRRGLIVVASQTRASETCRHTNPRREQLCLHPNTAEEK